MERGKKFARSGITAHNVVHFGRTYGWTDDPFWHLNESFVPFVCGSWIFWLISEIVLVRPETQNVRNQVSTNSPNKLNISWLMAKTNQLLQRKWNSQKSIKFQCPLTRAGRGLYSYNIFWIFVVWFLIFLPYSWFAIGIWHYINAIPNP